MKKKKYLFSTNPLMYLTEIPPLALMIVAIYFNSGAVGNKKLYPLIIFLALVMIFIFIYLLRYIKITEEELRCCGPFSSHDAAIINKDKTLILTMRGKNRLRVALYGNDGMPPMFEGLRDEPSIDIFLFRARAFGGRRSVISVMTYFGIPVEDAVKAVSEERFVGDYTDYELTAERIEDIREIRIKFKTTL